MSTMKTCILDGATPSSVFIKKQVQKKWSQKYAILSAKNQMSHHLVSKSYLIIGHIAQHYTRVLSKITNLTNVDTSGDQNHFWLSIQKVEKLLDIIGEFWAKMRLSMEGWGRSIFRGSVWSSYCIFRLQNHNWFSAKKSKGFGYYKHILRRIT